VVKNVKDNERSEEIQRKITFFISKSPLLASWNAQTMIGLAIGHPKDHVYTWRLRWMTEQNIGCSLPILGGERAQ
jgi:hypothetical protein